MILRRRYSKTNENITEEEVRKILTRECHELIRLVSKLRRQVARQHNQITDLFEIVAGLKGTLPKTGTIVRAYQYVEKDIVHVYEYADIKDKEVQ